MKKKKKLSLLEEYHGDVNVKKVIFTAETCPDRFCIYHTMADRIFMVLCKKPDPGSAVQFKQDGDA